MKTLLLSIAAQFILLSIGHANDSNIPEEHLVEVHGKPAIDGGWLEFPKVNGRPIRVGFGQLSESAKVKIVNAPEIEAVIWQIRSGDVADPNKDGWYCEPVTYKVDGRVVFDGRICELHHIRMERVTKWASRGDLWDYGEAMYVTSHKLFPHGLPFVLLGQLFPDWNDVRSYQCEKCVAARERWERLYKITKEEPSDPKK